MDIWSILLSIVIGAMGIYYLFKNYNLFKRHGVIHIPAVPVFGNMSSVIFRQISFADFIKKTYNYEPNAKYIGMYTTFPVFLLRDPELIKAVLIKDFDAFLNRSRVTEMTEKFFTENLLSLQGEKWRYIRNVLTPSFTSSKMKAMFVLMSECAVDFVNYLSVLPASDSDVNIKEAFSKYANDVVATCAFGIKINSMKDPENEFYVYGKNIANLSGLRLFKFSFFRSFPKLATLLDLKFISKKEADFFTDCIQTTIATREAEHITRPDMLQLMMDVRNKEGQKTLDIEDIVAQAFLFFFAGVETASISMSFAAHALATNPDVQSKLRQEIDKVLEESDGKVTYEAINHLEYLEAVINETFRMYTPILFLERVCQTDYELPPALPGEKPFVMKKGMMFWIPIFAIHNDEKYYENPEEFRPERFLNKAYHNSPYFYPFGAGSRMCIANRFSMLDIKVLLFHLLSRCELKPCAKTTLPIRFSKNGGILFPENGFWLNVQRRKDIHPVLESTMSNGVKS